MTDEDVAAQFGIAWGAGVYQTLAVVGALAESGVIDQARVIAWARFFADNQSKEMPLVIRDGIKEGVNNFADVLTAISTVPQNAGRG